MADQYTNIVSKCNQIVLDTLTLEAGCIQITRQDDLDGRSQFSSFTNAIAVAPVPKTSID